MDNVMVMYKEINSMKSVDNELINSSDIHAFYFASIYF